MKIVNKKYDREYENIEEYEAGIVLTGAEVKSIRAGALRLDDSHVKILEGIPYVINAEIAPYRFANQKNYEPKQSRRLLLHKKELTRMQIKMKSSGLTVIPLFCYNKGALIKLKIALSRGRRDLEKRKREKARDVKTREKREAKEYLKR